MVETKETVILRKLEASEGMEITDVKTGKLRAKIVYLGCEDSPNNYKEIPEGTPVPEDVEEVEG